MGATCATVFGLDVQADVPLSFLEGARAAATGRRLDLWRQDGDASSLRELSTFELVCEHLEPGGKLSYRIERGPQAGYLLWGPSYGAHLLSADGHTLHCAPGDIGVGAWQRLLVAQVLPFAAVLRGLEVLHASAVVVEQRAVAFVGPSRSGKTSLALELCRRGASFLADDVLALESGATELLAHPGTPVAGIDHAEAQRVGRGRADADLLASNDRELLVRTQVADAPVPLTAVFFLERRVNGPSQPRFHTIADAGSLLGATFNFVLADPQRLRRLLDVCAAMSRLRVERVLAGPAVDASQLAQAVGQRLGFAP